MGCAAATARRRRKQARNGYKHLPPLRRPRYKTHTKEALDRRAAQLAERRKALEARRGRKRG